MVSLGQFRLGKNERKILLKARKKVMSKRSQPRFWSGDHVEYIYPKEDFEKQLPKHSYDSLVEKGFLRPKQTYQGRAYYITKKGRRFVVDELEK